VLPSNEVVTGMGMVGGPDLDIKEVEGPSGSGGRTAAASVMSRGMLMP